MTTDLKITIMAFALCFSGTTGWSATDRNDWPEMEIRLSPEGTLKDIFDSGLRPYRFPSLETSMLEVKHINAVVIQPNGFKLPVYEAQTITMGVRQGGLLSYMEFQNPRRTLEDCRAEMMRWIHLGRRFKPTESDLDEFLAAAKKDPYDYNNIRGKFADNFRVSWHDEYGIRYVVWFHKISNPEKPLAVYMKISFPRKPRPNRFYRIPIPPPPGYEEVDMTAPKNFGPDRIPRTPEEEKITREGIMPDPNPPPGFRYLKPPESSYNAIRRKSAEQPEAEKSSRIWWLLAGAASLATATAFGYRKWSARKKK